MKLSESDPGEIGEPRRPIGRSLTLKPVAAVVLVVGLLLGVTRDAVRLRRLTSERDDIRRVYGDMRIDDPTRIQAKLIDQTDTSFRWRLYLPAGAYTVAVDHAAGNSGQAVLRSGQAREVLVNANFKGDDNRWRSVVTFSDHLVVGVLTEALQKRLASGGDGCDIRTAPRWQTVEMPDPENDQRVLNLFEVRVPGPPLSPVAEDPQAAPADDHPTPEVRIVVGRPDVVARFPKLPRRSPAKRPAEFQRLLLQQRTQTAQRRRFADQLQRRSAHGSSP